MVLWSSLRRVPVFSKSLPSVLWSCGPELGESPLKNFYFMLWSCGPLSGECKYLASPYPLRYGPVVLSEENGPKKKFMLWYCCLLSRDFKWMLAAEGVSMFGYKYFWCVNVMLVSGPLWKKHCSKILQNRVDSCRFTLQPSREKSHRIRRICNSRIPHFVFPSATKVNIVVGPAGCFKARLRFV